MKAEVIEHALEIMLAAHKGQLDLDGKPAMLHPLTVGLSGSTDEAKVAGFLHDVMEDCDEWTTEKLLAEGIPAEVVAALALLTHNRATPYMDYIKKIIDSGNIIAQEVKMHDLRHNLARGMSGGHERQVVKHSQAKLAFVDAGLWKD